MAEGERWAAGGRQGPCSAVWLRKGRRGSRGGPMRRSRFVSCPPAGPPVLPELRQHRRSPLGTGAIRQTRPPAVVKRGDVAASRGEERE